MNEAQPQGFQLNLFGGPPEPIGESKEEFPPEIQQALAVLSGQSVPGEKGGMENLSSTVPPEGPNAQSRWQDRMTMLKKHELGNIITKLTEPNVRVLDIASREGEAELVRIYTKLGDPNQGYVGREEMLKTFADPNAERGFRCLVVIRWWKPIRDLKQKDDGYEKTGTPEEHEGSAMDQIKRSVMEMRQTDPAPPSGEQQILS